MEIELQTAVSWSYMLLTSMQIAVPAHERQKIAVCEILYGFSASLAVVTNCEGHPRSYHEDPVAEALPVAENRS
eukprot:6173652-Pleurochrysis_carterae.AAC.9